jgi:hypothetical protein
MTQKKSGPGAGGARGPVSTSSGTGTPRTVLGLPKSRNAQPVAARPERQFELSFSARLFGGLSWPDGVPPALCGPLPLRVGINEDFALMLPTTEWPQLRRALSAWCNAVAYLMAVATDEAQRHVADGEPVAPLSEADRLNAAHRLLARELAWERKAAARSEVQR